MEISERPACPRFSKNSSPPLSIFSVRDDYKMNDPAGQGGWPGLTIAPTLEGAPSKLRLGGGFLRGRHGVEEF